MPDEETQEQRWDGMGYDKVKILIQTHQITPQLQLRATDWIAQKETEFRLRAASNESDQIEIARLASAAERAATAAERASSAAERQLPIVTRQADAAERANTRATIALVIAIISIAATIISILVVHRDTALSATPSAQGR